MQSCIGTVWIARLDRCHLKMSGVLEFWALLVGGDLTRRAEQPSPAARFLADIRHTNFRSSKGLSAIQIRNNAISGRFARILISGAIAAGTLRGLPPPSPVITAIYCFPSTLKVTGKPCTDVPSRVSHNICPFFTSRTCTPRLMSPTSTQPPAVDRAAVRNGACCSYFQTSLMVFTS